jgi:spore coat protein U-like protein
VLLPSDFRSIAGGLTLIVASTAGAPALAQQDTANLNVTAQIQASCVVNGGSLNFGLYNSEEAKEGQGTFSYECAQGTNITLKLGAGQNPVSGSRAMKSGGGGTLRYQLFKDASHQDVWSDTETGGLTVQDTSDQEEVVQVYGLIEGGQGSPAGTYSDVVQITLNINP